MVVSQLFKILIAFQNPFESDPFKDWKNFNLFKRIIAVTLFLAALYFWNVIGFLHRLAFLNRASRFQIACITLLFNQGKFLHDRTVDCGIHSCMISRNFFFHFDQLSLMSSGLKIDPQSTASRSSQARL